MMLGRKSRLEIWLGSKRFWRKKNDRKVKGRISMRFIIRSLLEEIISLRRSLVRWRRFSQLMRPNRKIRVFSNYQKKRKMFIREFYIN
jgi:hypothetical protein